MTSLRPGRPPLANPGSGAPRQLVFSFAEGHVGYFEGIDAYPVAPGRYRYMPFRSLSHYKLGVECQLAGFARCSFAGPAGVVWFSVRATGEPGVLDVSDLGATP
jgi:hypothetical protein